MFFFLLQVSKLKLENTDLPTDGDIGVDIEPNCLTNPAHSLFNDENKHCSEFFIELLYAMEHFESIQHFGM